jgi:transcriptional regulator GlxA family with amidase domain
MDDDTAILSADVTAGRSMPSDSIQKTLQFMQLHFVEPLSLNQLATIANLSVLQFAAAFRREVGMPPYRYLSHLRVRVAKALLEQGMPTAMVAAEAGFFDQPHMYRHFRRVCGVTPGQYQAAVLRAPAAFVADAMPALRAERH